MTSLNKWFLSLPEGRQDVLRNDKWMLAEAAYAAGAETRIPYAPAFPHRDGQMVSNEAGSELLELRLAVKILDIFQRIYECIALRPGDKAFEALLATIQLDLWGTLQPDAAGAALFQKDAADAEAKTGDLLTWLAEHASLSLSFGPLNDRDEFGPQGWRVTQERGNLNDREWHTVATGSTPLEALAAARSAHRTHAQTAA